MESGPITTLIRFLDTGRGGWLVVAGLAAYILAATGHAWMPLGPGIDYWPAWTVLALAGLALGTVGARVLRPASPWLRPVEAIAIMALAAALLTDDAMTYQPLRDLGIYLKAGHHFLDGSPVYIASTLTERPADLTDYPFLYPPVTLPLFALLALLPEQAAQAIWVAGSAALALAALRLFGVRGRWLPLALLWPPLFQGLWVGNVAPAALVLFAVGPWFGAGLLLGAVFKSYTGIAALWLVRERRWRDVGIGVAMLAGLAAVTLPLTGVDPWRAWIEALRLYQVSAQSRPGLYGLGLARFVPEWAWIGAAVAAVVGALTAGGRDGLARLGSATIVASPSLWGHGMLVAVPSLLGLGTLWLWLGIGLTSSPDGLQWWWLVGLVAASWLLPALRRDPLAYAGETDPLDVLGEGSGAWPESPRSGVQATGADAPPRGASR